MHRTFSDPSSPGHIVDVIFSCLGCRRCNVAFLFRVFTNLQIFFTHRRPSFASATSKMEAKCVNQIHSTSTSGDDCQDLKYSDNLPISPSPMFWFLVICSDIQFAFGSKHCVGGHGVTVLYNVDVSVVRRTNQRTVNCRSNTCQRAWGQWRLFCGFTSA